MGERAIPALSRDAPDYSEFIGKYLIIGLTFLDESGEVIEQFQIHGPIVAIDDRKGIVKNLDDYKHSGFGPFAFS
jgi:hypothetical protein